MNKIYNPIKITLLAGMLLFAGSCKMETVNLNAPAEEDVLTTREGIIGLSVGLRQFESTSGINAAYFYPAVTARELQGVATFTNVLELEAGGTALPTANGNILTLWSNMQRLMTMSQNVIDNAPKVTTLTGGLLSGIMANAELFKAISLATLAGSFEQSNINTSTTEKVKFIPRAQVLAEAVRLLDDAIARTNTTPATAEFTTLVAGSTFDLKSVLYAFSARYNLMAGNYAAALASANLVDQTKANAYQYNAQSVNPIWNNINTLKYYTPRTGFGLPADLFETADQRLNFYVNTSTRTLTGFGITQTGNVPVYLPDEIKLIKAEAILRSGGALTDALTQINLVRTQAAGDLFGVNAGLPAYSGAVTQADLLTEVYRQRCAELFLSGQRWEDSRRFGRPFSLTNFTERNRNFYPYPDQERLNNPNTPADPAI
ncbi:SusD family protein [Pedobacter westerhofensis]|uniref:SusD family protein n=1 Tax=Pedobacter westerhofensis TaxID=425512 RepID=A0A521FHM1_9SPHI|nr:RagB/SusD family nutrient uptake outer membrane protein [Pedobacter westerhofensis]SMO95559.1 SusD family protein [Pedobacter westerhofensis]